MKTYSEAEIQLLIALIELEHPITTPNNIDYPFYPKNLAEASRYFRSFLVDWKVAYASLENKGLLIERDASYLLTSQGEGEAARLRLSRPPIYYWYCEFYRVTAHSPVNDLLCKRLYSKNLNQQGFMDMAQLDKLLEVTHLGPENRVLDLGCGNGLIAEYISDTTGAFVSGMDYIAEAIRQGQERTVSKQDHLEFKVGNLDHLEYSPTSFDTILAVDTLYMPNDLVATLQQMKTILTPGGQMAIYYSHALWEDPHPDPSHLLPEHTPIGEALAQVKLNYQTWDFTQADYQHALLKKQVAEEMKAMFAAEGNSFLYEIRIAEAAGVKNAIEAGSAARYLYLVKV